MKTNFDNNSDEGSNWKFGIFYYNKEDKRLWVPKRIPQLGYTLNYANPYSHVVTGIIILIASLLPLLFERL
jgi:uncharacterized membrane protein